MMFISYDIRTKKKLALFVILRDYIYKHITIVFSSWKTCKFSWTSILWSIHRVWQSKLIPAVNHIIYLVNEGFIKVFCHFMYRAIVLFYYSYLHTWGTRDISKVISSPRTGLVDDAFWACVLQRPPSSNDLEEDSSVKKKRLKFGYLLYKIWNHRFVSFLRIM